MALKRIENNQQRRLVDYSLTQHDINQGRTRHPSELTDSAKMAYQKKQFPAFQSVQKYNLDNLLTLDGGDDNRVIKTNEEGSKNVKGSGSSVHFLFKVSHQRHP